MKKMLKPVARGFTLIEIMVVVIILGLLASVAVPAVMDALGTATVKKARADMAAMQTSLKMYRMQNFAYPTTEQGLEALVTKPTLAPIPRNYKSSGYIEKLPKDPWGNDYQYTSPGDGHEYDVSSLGGDGISGGEGENADLSIWDEE
jgi:general secretion pathway protein G